MTTKETCKRLPHDDLDAYGISIQMLGKVMQAERKLAGFKTTGDLAKALFEITGVEKSDSAIKQYESGRAQCTFSYIVAFCITCSAHANNGIHWLKLLNNITLRSLGGGMQSALANIAFDSLNSPGYRGAYTEVLGRDADGKEIVATTKNDPNQQGQTPPIGGLE